jgi:Skp family chaperone for outer membrane proteins
LKVFNPIGEQMSDEKQRSQRKKRRGQQAREKKERRKDKAREANAASRSNQAKQKLDARICKLIEDGYSSPSIAKRLGVTLIRIKIAVEATKGR